MKLFSKLNDNFCAISLLIVTSIFLYSCTNDEFLEEKPLDFYTPENSFVTPADFEASLYKMYSVFRDSFYSTRDSNLAPKVEFVGTDLLYSDQNLSNGYPNLLNPSSGFVYGAFWKPAYQIIYNANVILERSESENSELTAEQKIKVQAEARFFRGYMHKLLADIYGGVPIVLEAVTSPKKDYVRATRKETYQQAAEDLRFAAENLPAITEVDDARISNLAAYHSLAEAYLALEEWNNSIEAASMAINDPNTALMTQRFGSRVDDDFNSQYPYASGGDPYWDLFRKDNQNRSSGNKEALWVIQYADREVSGGAGGGYSWEGSFSARTWKLQVKNNDGKKKYLIPEPNTFYGCRGAGTTRASDYFYNKIWKRSGDEDLRNSSYNIIRDIKVDNPDSDYDGQFIFADNVPVILKSESDTLRNWFPIIAKLTCMGDHDKSQWLEDQTVYGSLQGGLTTFRDIYQIRLAETYLIRAEAYMRSGNLTLAVGDINAVRERSQASAIGPEDLDIDFILDERARELPFEENRLATLMRLGKLVERTNKYNGTFDYYDYQNLWPIPQSEIEKNTEAVLEQNPGYN